MNKIAITGINVDLIDISSFNERDYIQGDTEFILSKWDINPAISYFEKSEATIKLSKLPKDLQEMFHHLEKDIIEYIKSLSP